LSKTAAEQTSDRIKFEGKAPAFERHAAIAAEVHRQRKNVRRQAVDKVHAERTSQKEKEDAEGPYVNPVTGEHNGPRGPEPTRYGDWAFRGRVTDF